MASASERVSEGTRERGLGGGGKGVSLKKATPPFANGDPAVNRVQYIPPQACLSHGRHTQGNSTPVHILLTPLSLFKMAKSTPANPESAKKRQTKSVKAGLVVPVMKIHKRIIAKRVTDRVGGPTAVYIAAVVEYILDEILSLAATNVQKDGKFKRVKPRDVTLVIRSDHDLSRLLASHRILCGDKLKSSADDFTIEADRKYKKLIADKNAANAVVA